MGGLASGALVYWLAPEAEGHGTDAAIDAYHHKGGVIRGRVPFVKALASALTIGSGGSGGREGPIAQIGAGFGSNLAQLLKLSPRERRILMAAGMGAGIGAIFHAPLAGALFASEVFYRDMDIEYDVIVASIISSIIAYGVFAVPFGWKPLFVTPDFVFERMAQLIPYLILAIVVALAAILYIKSFYGVRSLFHRLSIPLYIAPAIGGLLVGCIGFFLPEALGTGYGTIQKALVIGTEMEDIYGSISIGLLVAVFWGKIATTSFSIGSGGSGGVFGPSIVIGGVLGAIIGSLALKCFPGMNIQPGAFVIVGMAGFFAAAANTPISTIIMVSEMTGNYHLLVPSMWVCIVAYLLVRKYSLYENQLPNRFNAPVHMGNMLESVLRNIAVGKVIAHKRNHKVLSLSPLTNLRDMLEHFSRSQQSSFPVIDDNQLVGIVRGSELRLLIKSEADFEMTMIAEDLSRSPLTVTEHDSLLEAIQKMNVNELEEVAVVDKQDRKHLIVMLSLGDIISAYDRELTHRLD